MSGNIFAVMTWGMLLIQYIRARDAAKHPAVQAAAPFNRESSGL